MASTLSTIYDHSIFGGVDSSGNIKQVFGNEALKNAILLWVSLYAGEILREPLLGGYLIRLLMKPMSVEKGKQIEQELKRGLLNEFTPNLLEVSVQATPDFTNRKWQIYISAYCPEIKDSINLETTIKNIGN